MIRWYQVLALDALRWELQRRLATLVDDILDHLIDNGIMRSDDIAYTRIRGSQPFSSDGVDELLKFLITAGAGRESAEGTFSVFCAILRERVGLAHLAESLQQQAKKCEETMLEGDEDKCDLVRSMESLEELVERKVAESQVQTQVNVNRPVQTCLQILASHLSSKSEYLCSTMDDGSDLSCLMSDIRSCFVPLQAMSEKDAMRVTYQHHRRHSMATALQQKQHALGVSGSGGRSRVRIQNEDADVDGGKEFVLETAVQLLTGEAAQATALNRGACAGRTAAAAAADDDDAAAAAAAAAADAAAAAATDKSDDSGVKLETSCMVIGGAGQGKTTFCKRVIAEVTDAMSGPLAKFKFVFYIPCRNLERVRSESWIELLGLDAASMDLNGEEQRSVLRHLQTHSENVLVILDGIDEAGGDGLLLQSAAKALVKRSASHLLNATVVITSRPCQGAYDLVQACKLRYRLRGFSESQLHEFCIQQLGEVEGSHCVELLSQPGNRLLKEAIRKTPLLCALLCQQYAITESIPASITLFYTEFVCSAVAKLETRRRKSFGKVRLTRDVSSNLCGGRQFHCGELVTIETAIQHLLENSIDLLCNATDEECDRAAVDVVRALHNLGTLCLDGLQQGVAAFPSSRLSQQDLDVCLDLGLVVCVGSGHSRVRSTERISLVHLTIQEWCASRALVSLGSCVDTLRDCVYGVGMDESRFVFWRFVFGQLQPDRLCPALDTIQSVVTSAGGKVSKKTFLFMMRAVLENMLSLHPSAAFTTDDLLHTDIPSLGVYQSAARMLTADGINLYGAQLDTVDVMAVCNILRLIDNTPSLDVSSCYLSREHAIMLLPGVLKATKVDLSTSQLSGLPLEILATLLTKSPQGHVKELRLRYISWDNAVQDGVSLARCARCATLSKLDLFGSRAAMAVWLASFSSHMMPTQQLTQLNIGLCGLKSGCGPDLSALLSKIPSLTHIWLHSNSLSNADVKYILAALHSNRNIDIIDLHDNDLDDELLPSILLFLQARRSAALDGADKDSDTDHQPVLLPTVKVYLNGNHITTKVLEEIARSGHCGNDCFMTTSHYVSGPAVRSWSIQDLVRQHNSKLRGMLQDSMMPSLGEYLATSNALRLLDISSCRLTDTGATALAESGLAHNTSLQFITLRRNQIQVAGVIPIMSSVSSSRSAVRAVDLSWNPIFDNFDTSHALCQRLLQSLGTCRQLRYLSLSKTGLSDEIGIHIFQSLKQHRCIMWINLAGNQASDGTAHALADMKMINASLQLVSLEHNKISNVGILCLLQSRDIMAMEKIHLYSNPCSVSAFRPPLYNSKGVFTSQDILDYVSD